MCENERSIIHHVPFRFQKVPMTRRLVKLEQKECETNSNIYCFPLGYHSQRRSPPTKTYLLFFDIGRCFNFTQSTSVWYAEEIHFRRFADFFTEIFFCRHDIWSENEWGVKIYFGGGQNWKVEKKSWMLKHQDKNRACVQGISSYRWETFTTTRAKDTLLARISASAAPD